MEILCNYRDLFACKYVLETDTRLCHLRLHRGGKVKAERDCLLPYVQKLVTMQCNELGFHQMRGYYAKKKKKKKSSEYANSECKASLHEVRCHLKKKDLYTSARFRHIGGELE